MRLHPEGSMTRVENNTELEKDRSNIARLLQDQGYKTGFVGKSHVVDHHILNRPQDWKKHGLMTYDKDASVRDPEVQRAMRHNHKQWAGRIKPYGFDYANGVYAANLRELYSEEGDVHNVEWTTNAERVARYRHGARCNVSLMGDARLRPSCLPQELRLSKNAPRGIHSSDNAYRLSRLRPERAVC